MSIAKIPKLQGPKISKPTITVKSHKKEKLQSSGNLENKKKKNIFNDNHVEPGSPKIIENPDILISFLADFGSHETEILISRISIPNVSKQGSHNFKNLVREIRDIRGTSRETTKFRQAVR